MNEGARHVLAVVPARGGSKAIPRKNVRRVAGEPLLGYVLREARRSRHLTRVLVSTDDPEIAAVAAAYGTEAIPRPAEISGDKATSEEALLHALDFLRAREGYEPELLVFLQCTSPLTLAADIDGTVDCLLADEADSALAVMPFHYFIWQRRDGDGVGVNHQKLVRPMRQDRDPQFLEAGAVVAMRTTGFRAAKHRFFGRTALYEMPADRVLEIDEPHDLERAEILLRERKAARPLAELPARIAALVLDFDGVLTDNTVIVLEDGREAVRCSRSDSWGLKQLREAGVSVVILSYEANPVVAARARKMGVECLHGQHDKVAALGQWLAERGHSAADTVYLGNDVNDIGCLTKVGCGVVVADAHPAAARAARLVLQAKGGAGAVRELCDLILTKMGAI
jgi:YrbI family 3-deoxy-D-manno-octulosonate 8-phosphate phosphatase